MWIQDLVGAEEGAIFLPQKLQCIWIQVGNAWSEIDYQ